MTDSIPSFDLDPQKEEEILAKVAAAENEAALEEIRIAELGSQGRITTVARTIGTLPPDQRKQRGIQINQFKDRVNAAIAARRDTLNLLLPRAQDQHGAWTEAAAGHSPESEAVLAIARAAARRHPSPRGVA